MSFRFSAGYGVQAVTVETAFILNDNKWHTVYAERNRKQALLQVDEFEPVSSKSFKAFFFSFFMISFDNEVPFVNTSHSL